MTSRTHRPLTVAAMVLALALVPGTGRAADTEPARPDALTKARTLVQQKNWAAAVDELKRVNDSGNADWNNLMGYSLRKSGRPDPAAAEKFYETALHINPKHRGALEYSGELALITGDLAKAEQRLATLDKVCTLPCEEYSDLKKAVARYKANGNKYVATP